jgi:uncharacterized NAD(P)/FAD-binding protein YdhS
MPQHCCSWAAWFLLSYGIVYGYNANTTSPPRGRLGSGAISRRIFAVGRVTKAAFWEMTAVPDIRRQCEYLANHLSVLAKAVRPRTDTAWPPEISASSASL